MNLSVTATGKHNPGGAQNCYEIVEHNPAGFLWLHSEIVFQDGDPAKHGMNGITPDALLAVCFDWLERSQEGPQANAYNAEALANIERALEALKDRARERDSNEH